MQRPPGSEEPAQDQDAHMQERGTEQAGELTIANKMAGMKAFLEAIRALDDGTGPVYRLPARGRRAERVAVR